jgi:hypothetical protein
MLASDCQRISRAEKRRLHRQRLEALAHRQRQREQRIAAQRRTIPGVDQMRDALEEIEIAQSQMREAGASLRMVLNSAPLAEAYAQFKDEGGISAADWANWLYGKSLGGARHAGKRHLRIVSARETDFLSHRFQQTGHAAPAIVLAMHS